MSMLSIGLHHNLVEVSKLDNDIAYTLFIIFFTQSSESLERPDVRIFRRFFYYVIRARKTQHSFSNLTNSNLISKHAFINLRTNYAELYKKRRLKNTNNVEKNGD